VILYIFIILHQKDEMQFLLSSYKFKNYDDVKNFNCILIDLSWRSNKITWSWRGA